MSLVVNCDISYSAGSYPGVTMQKLLQFTEFLHSVGQWMKVAKCISASHLPKSRIILRLTVALSFVILQFPASRNALLVEDGHLQNKYRKTLLVESGHPTFDYFTSEDTFSSDSASLVL